MSTATLSFVIPVRNDAASLARCLRAIAANHANTPTECIVADNGSIDGSAQVAHELGARVLIAPTLGVSALRNRAAAMARGDILAFVDADHEIGSHWVDAVVDNFRDEHVGAVGAAYTAPANGTWIQQTYGALRGKTSGRREARWLASGNLAIRRALFEQLGGFDETLTTCEDVDLTQRLRHNGWRAVADERLVSVHNGDPRTLGELFKSERWRGRDNLRVSFRVRPSLWDVPSILTPIVIVAATALAALAMVAAAMFGVVAFLVAGLSLLIVMLLAAARAARMVWGSRRTYRVGFMRAVAVALVYEAARACSLVAPGGHRRARPATALRTGEAA